MVQFLAVAISALPQCVRVDAAMLVSDCVVSSVVRWTFRLYIGAISSFLIRLGTSLLS